MAGSADFSGSSDKIKEDWHSIFASKLLDDNFLLTALEFHAELIEGGRELPKLREFFSNPANFEQQSFGRPDVPLPRSSSQATLDSLDLTRFSEDGERASDEKVAVLEFELRKAKDTISALRANLTHAAVSDESTSMTPDSAIGGSQKQPSAIKPHEQRALNFLINEYLMMHNYKLTSITFADENESQDFDDWEDVGLNVPRPAELFYLYREGLRGTKTPSAPCRSVDCQTDWSNDIQTMKEENDALVSRMEQEIALLQKSVLELEKDKDDLTKSLSAMEEQRQTVTALVASPSPEQDMFELIDGSSETKSVQSNEWTKVSGPLQEAVEDGKSESEDKFLPTKESENDDEEIISELEKTESKSFDLIIPRNIPDGFKREILKRCDVSRVEKTELLKQVTRGVELADLNISQLISIQAAYLHAIIPNIILNKREDVIPALVLTICLSKDASERDQLLSLLYNLKKKPQEEERELILSALVTIAKTLGPAVTEEELLPQCWEQISHKYMERRLMVAQACCNLAPYVSETIRNSLLFSMVQQLTQDREEDIRCLSVHCLTLLVTLISVPDKYSQICELSVKLLSDSSVQVSQSVQSTLLPAVAQWSCELRRLQTDLLSRLLTSVSRNPSVVLLTALESLLPFLIMFIANSETVTSRLDEPHPLATKRQEFASLCKGLADPVVFFGPKVGSVVSAFDDITTRLEESTGWPELDWVVTEMIPRVLQLAQDNSENKSILQHTAMFMRHLCAGLGKNITYNIIKPELSRRLELCSSGLIAGEVRNLEMIPIYVIGLLSLGPNDGAGLEQVGGTLLEFLCGLPLCGASLLPLHVVVESLSLMPAHHLLLLDTLWEGVVHQRPLIRSATATLFQSVLPGIADHLLANRVAPALVTLASDPELSVKVAVIPTLGLLSDTKEKPIRDKITMTFQAMLTEAVSSGNGPLCQQMAATLAEHWERFEVPFRNEVILPQLSLLAGSCEGAKHMDLIKSLTETFSTVVLSSSQLSTQVLSSHVIPSLRHLESCCRQLELPHGERIESLLSHAERLLPSNTGPMVPEPVLSPTQRVEDVKNRVTKMFNTRPQSLQSVSGIFKKKP